jgi:hypothetical protein
LRQRCRPRTRRISARGGAPPDVFTSRLAKRDELETPLDR